MMRLTDTPHALFVSILLSCCVVSVNGGESDLAERSRDVGHAGGLFQVEQLLDDGVDDFDILSNSMKPEMVKRLTESEAKTLRSLESDVLEAKSDLNTLRDESESIVELLNKFKEIFADMDDASLIAQMTTKIENLSKKIDETSGHLQSTNDHFADHEEELHRLHTEVFATQIAADVMDLMKKAKGVDYSSGDVRLDVQGLDDQVSLQILKDKLLQSLEREKERASRLSQRLTDPAIMQLDFDLLVDMCSLIVAAAIGGTLAALMHVPTIIGQILGGLIIGPSGLHVVKDITSVHTMSQLGSVFILFRKGLHFPMDLSEQSNPKGLETGGAIMCIVAVTLSIIVAGSGMATTASESIMYGVTMCISSTGMVKKLVADRRTTSNEPGAATTLISSSVISGSFAKQLLAIASINDLSIGFILAIPIALVGGLSVFVRIFISVLVFGLASLFFRTHVAPAAFSLIATRPNLSKNGIQALLFLGTIAWCILFALSTDILGLSIECGAFASGVYLAGTPNIREVSVMIDAVTILFGSLYFASVGMILNLEWSFDHAWTIASIVTKVTIAKVFVAFAVLAFLKYSWKSALLAGVALAHVGDFSLLYASKAHRLGLIDRTLYLHVLIAIVIMVVALPVILRHTIKALGDAIEGNPRIASSENRSLAIEMIPAAVRSRVQRIVSRLRPGPAVPCDENASGVRLPVIKTDIESSETHEL